MEKEVSIAALMTAPRYESVYARTQIERVLGKLGIPLTISGGVYYGQCMQIMLSELCEKPVKYALTVDFDSLFVEQHVTRLINIIAQEDHIDALAGLQPQRGKGSPLGSTGKRETMTWTGQPIKVRTAHFGLTIIDLDKLRQTPRPWFVSQPDPDGNWTDDKTDDDVYFWFQWEKAGNSVYLDPGCRIGHYEEMATVYDVSDGGIQLRHLYPSQWEDIRATTVD